ncbi:MOSC domain-containing protein [Lysobacter auxotrophicus]|uniref:MOSC domain-containing protein n=1 Tax=Lysobacter auxotrophicus TaxID=2992573 RepID=A0ABM8DCF7_9GAMM|nr:MOSC N-terminal beta barrel domain-containing protein [Lysobacter auxotrophicus]BDU16265.1 MOSC domain-containing protein [Lysobacter auxotrophicus]
MKLSDLYLYPVKSCAPLALEEARVESRGLAGDRRWMIVDADGRFVTGRQFPELTLLRARPADNGLTFDAPGMPTLSVPLPAPSEHSVVEIWKKPVGATFASDDAGDWLSRYLGSAVRLVYMDDTVLRQVDPTFAREGDIVGFADSFPIMLLGRGSLDRLNSQLDVPVSMTRFRPNFVVDVDEPHAEDAWTRIAIGELEFDVAKDCTRCNFVNIDPATGRRSHDGQPLKTLTGYRRFDAGVTFGRHLIPRSFGVVRRGDAVRVLG